MNGSKPYPNGSSESRHYHFCLASTFHWNSLTRESLREYAGVMPYHSLGIENADPERGALFHEYLAYADYLNECMREQYPTISLVLDHETGAGLLCRVVEDALCDTNNLYNQIVTTVERVKRQTNKYRQSMLLQGVFDASVDIYEKNKTVSQRAVAHYLDISRRKLRNCDGAVALVNMINRGELTAIPSPKWGKQKRTFAVKSG